MKKLLSITLAILMCLSLGLTLVSCDEIIEEVEALSDELGSEVQLPTEEATVGADGISKEEWQEAVAHDNFTNVTIEYELENSAGEKQHHIVKITEDKVYRKMTAMMGGEEFTHELCFTDENAKTQGKMFVDIFLSLLAERENFVYDMEAGVYNAPEKVSATVDTGEGYTANETMEKGQVKFAKDGSLEYFTCDLTEEAYEGATLLNTGKYAAKWTFKDYGKTEITAEEAAVADDIIPKE